MTTLLKLAAEYRPSMDLEIVHSWAKDVVAALTDKAVVPTADGWTPWAGGECPVGKDVLIDVKDRDGMVHVAVKAITHWSAKQVFWMHKGTSDKDDIIAYRLAQ